MVNAVPPPSAFGIKPSPLPSCSGLGDQSEETCGYCKTFLEKGTAGACSQVETQIQALDKRLGEGAPKGTDAGSGMFKRKTQQTIERISQQYLIPCQSVRDDVTANAATLRGWVQLLHPHFERFSFGTACADVGCCRRGIEVPPVRACARESRDSIHAARFCSVCKNIVEHRLLSLSAHDPKIQRQKFDCPYVQSKFSVRDEDQASKLESLCFDLDQQMLSDESFYYTVYLRAKELFRETVCWQWNPTVLAADPCPELLEDICRDMACC